MADPTADNPELAVDELRRKARRRLIGAVVLALAAATLVPLLLEQDQRPLGDDVSVQIPPIDDGKFVSRLAGDKGKEGAPPAKPEGTPATVPGREARAEPKGEARAEPKVEAKAEPPTEPKAEPKTEPKMEPKAAAPEASASAAEAASKAEGFVVQLGAFTDVYGANALANRLKKAGYPAYTEPIETNRGKLWRVRVGAYPSRAAAVEARDRLKADGHNGLVSPAK